ncbi:MAG: ATP-binding protein [Rhodopirellula sp. JB044]|uniref:ATP-binding protein n=1 Tax=Rhodopirellula sp. JB044 TaxID=3342844 RepID=UPI00370C63D4
MQSQTITCPQGHQLRASKRVFGKTLPCPVCKQLLTVPLFPPPPSDPVASDAAASEEKKDSLSDTGVMRILGDYVARNEDASDNSLDEKARSIRSCPVCDSSLSEAATICKNCKCYVGPTPDFFKQFAR